MAKKLVDYTVFLPAMASMFRGKDKNDNTIEDAEFKAIIATAFRDTVITFMQDAKLYRISVPIDLYKGIVNYDIMLPFDGYRVESAIRLKAGTARVPDRYDLDEHELILRDCCPSTDMNKALYVEVAIVPSVTSNICTFDSDFIDRYYDVILAGMIYKLSQMPQREWFLMGTIQYNRSEYMRLRNRAVFSGTDSTKPRKLGYKRLSDVNLRCPK